MNNELNNELKNEPVWCDVCEQFDIEKVKQENRNIDNPLFPIVSRLARLLEREKNPSTEILSLTSRFFNYFERSAEVAEARRYLFNLFKEDYSQFSVKLMLLVQMVISEQSEYYY